jgi:hypothetical protein
VSFLSSSDPLALLAIQAGQINAPADATAAQGTTELDSPQRFAQIGEPVPIVFARFRNSKGGILISPGATEARFENDASNNVTAYYMLVLSEGQLDSIPVKDVFQRACRVGAHTQTYNRRAGTWTPGNFLVQRAGKDLPEAPFFCGTVGSYPGISTLSFNVTIPDGFDQYNRQVHLFIRGGMAVTRIYDSVTGSSDNFADLVKWLLVNTSRVPAAMIDNTALLAAATFLEVNGFTCNLEIRESTNYSDLAARLAPYFLLAESNAGGKRGLRPLLPVTAGGAIKTTAITAEYTFTEDTVLPGTLEINYLSLADRQPFVAQVIWRQQLESDIGIIRTAEVRYSGTAETGPYESHDLSTFCTNEDHAVKVGAYILAKRLYTTHTIRFAARPQEHNTLISAGDIIRVQLARDNTTYANSVHDYLYQVERITKTLAGDVSYEATHFPIDDQGRSLIALDVAAAVGTGIILPSGRTGVSCDVNSSSDNTIPAETFTAADGADPLELSPSGGGLGFDDSAPTGDTGNADDGLDASASFPPNPLFPTGVTAGVGSTLAPFTGPYGPCGVNQTESITWFKDGTKIATVTFNTSGNPISVVAEPGQAMPTWLNSTTPGILAIGSTQTGVYTSITKCFSGATYGSSTTGDRSTAANQYTYLDQRLVYADNLDVNVTWKTMAYFSYGSPSWSTVDGSVYRIDENGDVVGNGVIWPYQVVTPPQIRTYQISELVPGVGSVLIYDSDPNAPPYAP